MMQLHIKTKANKLPINNESGKDELLQKVVAAMLVLVLCGCSTLPREEVPVADEEHHKAVVFDIDGTLTPNPISVFSTRDKAVDAVTFFSEKGFSIIYLSARNPYFQWIIPGWLSRNDFPQGYLHVPQSQKEHNHPASFKQSILQEYVEKGWDIEAAFGDTTTDFEAYIAVGIPRQRVYALQRVGSKACQSSEEFWSQCFTDWNGKVEKVFETFTKDE